MTRRLAPVLALLLLAAQGCAHTCTAFQTRCNGQIVEVCAGSGKWRRAMDCSQVRGASSPWGCVQLPAPLPSGASHTCVPEGQQP